MRCAGCCWRSVTTRPARRLTSRQKCEQPQEVSYVRGLESTPCQLSFPAGDGVLVWESLDPQARERVLRVLATVIGRIVSGADGQEGQR